MFVKCGSQGKKNNCNKYANMSVFRRMWFKKKKKKASKWIPTVFQTHTYVKLKPHPHPLPAAQASLPLFSWVSEWEIKFFWWETFSCPHSSPPIFSSHQFFLIYLLIYELLIYSVWEKQLCSEVFRLLPRSQYMIITDRLIWVAERQERWCISIGTEITVHQVCDRDNKLQFGVNCYFQSWARSENKRCEEYLVWGILSKLTASSSWICSILVTVLSLTPLLAEEWNRNQSANIWGFRKHWELSLLGF